MIKKTIVATLAMLTLVASSHAEIGFSVHRSADGKLGEQAKANLKLLVDKANENGTVRVWVDFGVAFQPDPALRTPEIVAQEAADRDAAISEFIDPIIEKGLATRIAVEPEPAAPGCMLNISAQGIRRLANDKGVKYIGYLPTTE